MESKYELAFCVFFNASIHGKDEDSSPDIDSHFLILHSLDMDVFYHSQEFSTFMHMINASRRHYARYIEFNQRTTEHPVIRNYKCAVVKKNYICLVLSTGMIHIEIIKNALYAVKVIIFAKI